LATLVHCNGPGMHHLYFNHLLMVDKLPTDLVGADFIRYCTLKEGGKSVISKREGIHWSGYDLPSQDNCSGRSLVASTKMLSQVIVVCGLIVLAPITRE
jgi:hypothetical protein